MTGVDLRFDLRHALLPLAEAERIGGALTQATALAARLGDAARLGKAHAFLGNHHWWVGAYDLALAACRRARELGHEAGDATVEVSAAYDEALVHHARGDYRQAATLLRQTRASVVGGLTTRRSGMEHFTAVVSSAWLAWSLTELGEIAEAEAVASEAVRMAAIGHHPFLMAHAYAACGFVALRKGDVDASISWFERFRESERPGDLLVMFPLGEW